MKRTRSFTTVELLIVVVIMAVVALVTVPGYVKTIEKSKARSVWKALQMIQHAERIYRSDSGSYLAISEVDPDSAWKNLKLDNPNVTHAGAGYQFSVTVLPLKVKARRTKDSAAYEINEAGTIANPDGKLPSFTY